MKIGIFGGTFDPIHAGHLRLARAAQEQFALSRILFIPAAIPPHKNQEGSRTPAAHRYRMAEMAVRYEKDFEVSDIELTRPGVSYTVDTLESLKKKNPGDDLYLIVGSDALQEIPSWKNSRRIRELVTFLAARRPGAEAPGDFEGKVEWIEMTELDLSSSGIRERIRKGEKIPEQLMDPNVLTYIKREGLYTPSCP